MALQGIGGSVPVATFRSINVQAHQTGREITADKMAESQDHVSNFGNETHLGNGQFSQMSEQIASEAVDAMANIMEQDDEFEGSVNGSGTPFSSSGFQEANATSFDPAQARAASSYAYFNQ